MENTGLPVEEAKINNAEIIQTRSKESEQDLSNKIANAQGTVPEKVPYIKGEVTLYP